jgi:hypothetical protein
VVGADIVQVYGVSTMISLANPLVREFFTSAVVSAYIEFTRSSIDAVVYMVMNSSILLAGDYMLPNIADR